MYQVVYQEQVAETVAGGDVRKQQPFICGIMTPWQCQQLAKLGHGATLELDCTFGTNKYMVCFWRCLGVGI
jgi:hypothetical protein